MVENAGMGTGYGYRVWVAGMGSGYRVAGSGYRVRFVRFLYFAKQFQG